MACASSTGSRKTACGIVGLWSWVIHLLKRFGALQWDGLSSIIWETRAWDALVLPSGQKDLLKAVIKNQRQVGAVDVIKGKGEGSTFLLYGPPGTGKTLTAEAMAELLQKPLYVMSAGEMGTTPEDLESRLSESLRLCAKWDCLCLIDEADTFLEQRRGSDVLRNALVCVMLRLLEYHQGVFFMTSNKVKGIDSAVQSRLTLALRYDPLDEHGRKQVWSNLIQSVSSEKFDVASLAHAPLNGRQIKNCIRLSLALAMEKGEKLSQDVLQSTLGTICSFQQDLNIDEDNERPDLRQQGCFSLVFRMLLRHLS